MPPREAARPDPPHGYRPLVVVRRGGVVESVHHGAIVVADASGRVDLAYGDAVAVTFLRSAAKPFQALPLLQSGAVERFGLTDEEVAVMIGSHGGEPFHVAAVQSILKKIGLGEEALQCGAHPPFHKPSAQALREAGLKPSAIHNNCSGKHAGMLALAVHLGAPTATYLEPKHPVQEQILDALTEMIGRSASAVPLAVDGCSAPTFGLPLASAATLYARLASPEGLRPALAEAARRAVATMRGRPEMVAGTGRICTTLMREGQAGLIAKIGAEGFYGAGLERDGRGFGIALKVADGDGEWGRSTATGEALRQLGLASGEAHPGLFDG